MENRVRPSPFGHSECAHMAKMAAAYLATLHIWPKVKSQMWAWITSNSSSSSSWRENENSRGFMRGMQKQKPAQEASMASMEWGEEGQDWPRATSNQIRVRLASQVACNGFFLFLFLYFCIFWPAQQMQFWPNMAIACCEPKSGQSQTTQIRELWLRQRPSPPSPFWDRGWGWDSDLDLAKCRRRHRHRRHFGQFLHLRKRSQDRLRACGDLTVFSRPAATKRLARKVTPGQDELIMPLEAILPHAMIIFLE